MMHVAPNADEAAAQCAHYLAQLVEDALQERGRVSVALSGGSTPKRMFGFLLQERTDWARVEFWQVDERAVPPGHPQSNYTMIEEHFLRKAGVAAEQFHRMRGEEDPALAARAYAEELKARLGGEPAMDVVVCGVGPDAHTASLFPGDGLALDRVGLVGATYVEKFEQHRITLLPRVLLQARSLLVLAAGADKAGAMAHVFDDRTPVLQAPAKLLFETSGSLHWYLDEAASPR